jgi:hypothetical protein
MVAVNQACSELADDGDIQTDGRTDENTQRKEETGLGNQQ